MAQVGTGISIAFSNGFLAEILNVADQGMEHKAIVGLDLEQRFVDEDAQRCLSNLHGFRCRAVKSTYKQRQPRQLRLQRFRQQSPRVIKSRTRAALARRQITQRRLQRIKRFGNFTGDGCQRLRLCLARRQFEC